MFNKRIQVWFFKHSNIARYLFIYGEEYLVYIQVISDRVVLVVSDYFIIIFCLFIQACLGKVQ